MKREEEKEVAVGGGGSPTPPPNLLPIKKTEKMSSWVKGKVTH